MFPRAIIVYFRLIKTSSQKILAFIKKNQLDSSRPLNGEKHIFLLLVSFLYHWIDYYDDKRY